jgi:hypothetical protein
MKILILILLFYFNFGNYAYAYLDPGTGSAILAAIVAFIAAAITTINSYWIKIKKILNKVFSKNKDKSKTK